MADDSIKDLTGANVSTGKLCMNAVQVVGHTALAVEVGGSADDDRRREVVFDEAVGVRGQPPGLGQVESSVAGNFGGQSTGGQHQVHPSDGPRLQLRGDCCGERALLAEDVCNLVLAVGNVVLRQLGGVVL